MGALNRKRIAALARLAAFNRDSGSLRGSRCIWGGRAEVRRVPYMAAVVPVRSNPVIKNVYAQLRARGKYPEPTFTVRMRKLLVVLNAMLRSKMSWQTPAFAACSATLPHPLGAVPDHALPGGVVSVELRLRVYMVGGRIRFPWKQVWRLSRRAA